MIIMEIEIVDNEDDQIFSCIKKAFEKNGCIITEDFYSTYNIYKKYTLFRSFKGPIVRFEYYNCTMYIDAYNESQYNKYTNIIKSVLENIKGLTIKIEKHYKDCNV